MITLNEIFNALAYGELSNLSLRQDSSNTLAEEHHPKIVSHINIGLIELYKRFNLLQGDITLHQQEDVTTYYLRSEYTGELADIDADTYIELAAGETFQNNIIKVLKVYDALGEEISLNDATDSEGVMTKAFDTLTMTPYDPPEILSLIYQAYYPKIVVDPLIQASAVSLYIPDFIIEPLLFYVASRVYKPMGTNASTADADKSVSYMQAYELACQKINMLGLDTEVNDTRDRFTANGWA